MELKVAFSDDCQMFTGSTGGLLILYIVPSVENLAGASADCSKTLPNREYRAKANLLR